MDRQIIDLYDEFRSDGMNRRQFLDHLSKLAGSMTSALALLLRFQKKNAWAQKVDEKDDRLEISRVEYDASETRMSGYMARLREGTKKPAVVVIHENRGLNAHIRDVTRRMAVEGFLSLAPDTLSPLGGTPAEENRAREMLGGLNSDENVARLAAAVPFLARHPESSGKVGVVGFCWGGGMVNRIAAAGTSLNAGVSYYGSQLPAADVPKISAPLLLHYASLDQRINAGIEAFEAALKANNKPYEIYMYEGAGHAFNNDTNPERYDRDASDLAWERTIKFLKLHLKG